jgi:hypothetical protein
LERFCGGAGAFAAADAGGRVRGGAGGWSCFFAVGAVGEVSLSTPLFRYRDEVFLKERIPEYQTIEEEPNTFRRSG